MSTSRISPDTAVQVQLVWVSLGVVDPAQLRQLMPRKSFVPTVLDLQGLPRTRGFLS
jgi:hypothetical protein